MRGAVAAIERGKRAFHQFRLIARSTMLLGTAAAKRLQIQQRTPPIATPRAIRNAAEEAAAAKKVAKKAPKKKNA
jgi:hypothetical protein